MGSLPYGKALLPRPLALSGALAVVLLAGGGGWLAADKLARGPVVAPPPPEVAVRTGPAELRLRAGWQLDPKVPRVPGLDDVDARALAPSDGGRGRMVVAVLPGEPGELPATRWRRCGPRWGRRSAPRWAACVAWAISPSHSAG